MGSEMDISMCYIHTSYGGGYKFAKIYSVFSGDPQFSLHSLDKDSTFPLNTYSVKVDITQTIFRYNS